MTGTEIRFGGTCSGRDRLGWRPVFLVLSFCQRTANPVQRGAFGSRRLQSVSLELARWLVLVLGSGLGMTLVAMGGAGSLDVCGMMAVGVAAILIFACFSCRGTAFNGLSHRPTHVGHRIADEFKR